MPLRKPAPDQLHLKAIAAFNRTIAGGHSGNGVAQVIITLYPTP
ncbi:MAG: hypothetical protein ACOYNY_33025 [Caldilineaceae bacterium]